MQLPVTILLTFTIEWGSMKKQSPYAWKQSKYGKRYWENFILLCTTCNNLAILYTNMGQYEKAESLYTWRQSKYGKRYWEKYILIIMKVVVILQIYTGI